jgi:hypothetical protein
MGQSTQRVFLSVFVYVCVLSYTHIQTLLACLSQFLFTQRLEEEMHWEDHHKEQSRRGVEHDIVLIWSLLWLTDRAVQIW